MTIGLIRESTHTQRDKHREDGPVMTLAEMGIMQPYAKEYLVPPESGRSQKKKVSFLKLQRKHSPANTLASDFWSPECERVNYYCFKPPSLGSIATAALRN